MAALGNLECRNIEKQANRDVGAEIAVKEEPETTPGALVLTFRIPMLIWSHIAMFDAFPSIRLIVRLLASINRHKT
jgi:hypothetical protein